MKETIQAEETNSSHFYYSFEETEFDSIAVRESVALEATVLQPQAAGLDNFVAAIRWIFLYIPGATAIHFIMMGMALLVFYDNWSLSLMVGTFGVAAVSAFMIMLGMGKLSDLRYLRVVAAIFAAGGLAAIFYSLLIAFIPGDFFGLFTQLTLLLTLLIGYLVKRREDSLNGGE